MTIAKYRPQGALLTPFNEFVNEFFGRDMGQLLGSDEARRSMPSVNILDRNDGFQLELLAPGFSKQDLKVNVDNDVLTISAETKSESLQENERYTRREFTHHAFSRSFKLPEGVDADQIKAEHVNGVLRLHIPKVQVVKPKAKEIAIG